MALNTTRFLWGLGEAGPGDTRGDAGSEESEAAARGEGEKDLITIGRDMVILYKIDVHLCWQFCVREGRREGRWERDGGSC